MLSSSPLKPRKMSNFTKLCNYLKSQNFILKTPNKSEIKNYVDLDTMSKVDNNIVKVRTLNETEFFDALNEPFNDSREFLKKLILILKNNFEIFEECEIINHGILHSRFEETYKEMLNLLTNKMKYADEVSSKMCQILLNNENLFEIINLILESINHNILLTVDAISNSTLSAFLLINLINDSNTEFMRKINICCVKDSHSIGCNSIITGNLTKVEKYPQLRSISIYEDHSSSTFVILENADIFSSVISFIKVSPNVCLVQESVYKEFLNTLKDFSGKSDNLLDKNRKMNVRFIKNSKNVIEILKNLKKGELIGGGDICLENNEFISSVILDKIQPANSLFYHSEVASVSSFILTFRTIDESCTLANQLYKVKNTLYLWTENGFLSFGLRRKMLHKNVVVNTSKFLNSCNLVKKISCNKIYSTNKFKKLTADDIYKSLKPFKSSNKIEFVDFSKFNLKYDGFKDLEIKEFCCKMPEMAQLLDQRVYLSNVTNIITESFPVGNVAILMENIDEISNLEIVLASLLIGNNTLVILTNENVSNTLQLLSKNLPNSFTVLMGNVDASTLNNSNIDSVIDCLSILDLGEVIKSKFLYTNLVTFNDYIPFLIRKSTFVFDSEYGNTK